MALEGLIQPPAGHLYTSGNLQRSRALCSSLCLRRPTQPCLRAALAVSLPCQGQARLLGPRIWSHPLTRRLFQQTQARPLCPSIRGRLPCRASHKAHLKQDQSALQALRRRHETPQIPDMGQTCAAMLASPPPSPQPTLTPNCHLPWLTVGNYSSGLVPDGQ